MEWGDIYANKDFAYVVPNTVWYWLTQRRSIIEYKLMGNEYAWSELDGGQQVVDEIV